MQKALATFYLNTQLLSQVIVLTRKANPGDADLKCHTLPLYQQGFAILSYNNII